ncbi:MAG: mycofactocin-coupled SDR family oxidoreductase [Actinomycetota bacterium]|nr:mycofactocin-coupled SDR family oxidoreductase [Actinomycetota bacterium]
MGKLDGRVAFVTGAARGQGRAHAVRLAGEGAAIVAVDICGPIESVPYPLSSDDDLAATVSAVEEAGGRIVARRADVRDAAALQAALDEGIAAFGPIGIVVANAGIAPMAATTHDDEWGDVVDVNLSGTYNTVRLALPSMIEAGQGGSIVLITSVAGLTGSGGNSPGMLAYTASKHGVVGLTRAWANYLAEHNIRVNAVAPSGVRTPMVINDVFRGYVANHKEYQEAKGNALPGTDLIEPEAVADAVAWLVSDEARYVTGTVLPVDAGNVNYR